MLTRLERWTSKYRESQPTGWETHEKKSPWNLGQDRETWTIINELWQLIVDKSERLKTPEGSNNGVPQHLCEFTYITHNNGVQFSSVMSDSLWSHEQQHARPPCPSSTPAVYANSCPVSQWCHPTISSSVIPFSSCPQSFPASGSFQISQLFTSGGQSIRVSASTSVLPMNTQDWSPLEWTGWTSLLSKGLSRELNHLAVCLKLTHHCKWTIFQYKIKVKIIKID